MKLSRVLLVLAIVFSLIMIFGCSAEKKLARLVKNHPELVRKDTTYIRDTIYIPAVRYDTVTNIVMYDTTTVIDNSRMIIKYFMTDSTVYMQGECKDTNITKEYIVVTDTIVNNIPPWWKQWIPPVVAILIAFLVYRLWRRFLPGL